MYFPSVQVPLPSWVEFAGWLRAEAQGRTRTLRWGEGRHWGKSLIPRILRQVLSEVWKKERGEDRRGNRRERAGNSGERRKETGRWEEEAQP